MSRKWSPLSNHGNALVALARRPDIRIRELAGAIGLTERSAHSIVNDLVGTGYVDRVRLGRRNHYLVHGDRPIRHPVSSGHQVSALLRALVPEVGTVRRTGARAAVVLACSDHRFQEPVIRLLAAEGLLGTSEVFMWPGGSAALGGEQSAHILKTMSAAVHDDPPDRVVLVAHQGCRAPGARVRSRLDAIETGRAVIARRRRGIDRVRHAFGVEPELWFLTQRMAYRAKSAASFYGPAENEADLAS